MSVIVGDAVKVFMGVTVGVASLFEIIQGGRTGIVAPGR